MRSSMRYSNKYTDIAVNTNLSAPNIKGRLVADISSVYASSSDQRWLPSTRGKCWRHARLSQDWKDMSPGTAKRQLHASPRRENPGRFALASLWLQLIKAISSYIITFKTQFSWERVSDWASCPGQGWRWGDGAAASQHVN